MDHAWKSWSGQLPFISNCLAHHKGSIECIESIAQDLIEFQKQIDFHWQPVSEHEEIPICSGTIEIGSPESAVSNEKEYGNSQDSKNLFEKCTIRKLLENIKTSFLSEVGKLQMTFEKLKLSIEVTTDTLNPESKREEVNKTYRSYLEQYIEEILGQLNDRKRENAHLKDEIMELSKKADKLEAEEISLKSEIENLKKEIDTQKLEITNITAKERASIRRTRRCVQLYCLKSGAQISMVVQEVMSLLKTVERFGNKNLAFNLCEHQKDIQAKSPLLVLCFNTSGIATDVMNTLKGIPNSENTAMLIFHHKDEHALPNLSSLRVLVNPEFKRFGGIFDMAFLAGKGVYPCKMNTDALNGVMEFLTKKLKDDVV